MKKIVACHMYLKKGYKFGKDGMCHLYIEGNEESRLKAYKKAEKDGRDYERKYGKSAFIKNLLTWI